MTANQAAAALWVAIPDAPPPRAKPAKSWKLLRPNQRLALTDTITLTNRTLTVGTEVTVASVDSLSAELRLDDGTHFLWTNPEWKAHFERVRKRKKRETK